MGSSNTEFSEILDLLMEQQDSPKAQPSKESTKVVGSANQPPDPLGDVNLFISLYSRKRPTNDRFYPATPKTRPRYHNPTTASSKREAPRNQENSLHRPERRVSLTPLQLAALQLFIRLGAKEINEHSTINEIKRAFRKLARQWHPDSAPKNSNIDLQEQSETFSALREAYQEITKVP